MFPIGVTEEQYFFVCRLAGSVVRLVFSREVWGLWRGKWAGRMRGRAY